MEELTAIVSLQGTMNGGSINYMMINDQGQSWRLSSMKSIMLDGVFPGIKGSFPRPLVFDLGFGAASCCFVLFSYTSSLFSPHLPKSLRFSFDLCFFSFGSLEILEFVRSLSYLILELNR